MIFRLTILLLAILLTPMAGGAQSLLSGFGLGLPSAPLDARARSLGVSGPGLPGWHILSSDIASSGGVALPSISFTLQSAAADVGEDRVFGQTRFPQMAVSFPFGWNVFSLELGSFLGQEWSAERPGFLSIGGVAVTSRDIFASSGGVARLQVGWSRRLIEPLSVGVSAGRYLGSIQRSFERVIDGTSIGQGVQAFLTTGEWQASGAVLGGGFVYDPSPLLRLSGGVTWSDDLTLRPAEDSSADGGEYTIPMEIRGGGTLTLIPGLSLVLGASYADWTATREDLTQAVSGEGASLSYGGGVELSSLSLVGKPVFLRLGARHLDLPFAPAGMEGSASERTLSGGLGLHLVEGAEFPLAKVDFGIERGTRTGITDDESFWRLSLSLGIAGS